MINKVSKANNNSNYLFNICQQILLPEKGKYLDKKYKKEYPKGTPFIVACEKGVLNDVETFIKSGTIQDVNMKGRDSYGNFSYVFKEATKEIFDYLIEYQLNGATDIESIITVYKTCWKTFWTCLRTLHMRLSCLSRPRSDPNTCPN